MSTLDKNVFSKSLKDRLQELGMNQSELARKVGVNRATVSSWIAGRNYARHEVVMQIADVLKTTPAFFYGEKRDRDADSVGAEMHFNPRLEAMLKSIMEHEGYDSRKEAIAALIREKAERYRLPAEEEWGASSRKHDTSGITKTVKGPHGDKIIHRAKRD